jgi:hypothetical protein
VIANAVSAEMSRARRMQTKPNSPAELGD